MPLRNIPVGEDVATCADRFAAFERAFVAHAPAFACRREAPDDRAFLIAQFVACSPLTAALPKPMVVQQAELQIAAHNAAFPHALRVIVVRDDRRIGRLMIDWSEEATHLVDIAVLPALQRRGVGLSGLQAWLTVTDALGLTASLSVRADNPARMLYAALGFVPDSISDSVAFVAMTRPALRHHVDE